MVHYLSINTTLVTKTCPWCLLLHNGTFETCNNCTYGKRNGRCSHIRSSFILINNILPTSFDYLLIKRRNRLFKILTDIL